MAGPNITNITRRDQRRRKKSPRIDVGPTKSVSYGTSYKDKKLPIPQEPGREPHVLLAGEILWTSQYGLTPEGKSFQEREGGWSLANKTGRTLARNKGNTLAGQARWRGLKTVREHDESVAEKKEARSKRMTGFDTRKSRRKSGGLVNKTYKNTTRTPKRA